MIYRYQKKLIKWNTSNNSVLVLYDISHPPTHPLSWVQNSDRYIWNFELRKSVNVVRPSAEIILYTKLHIKHHEVTNYPQNGCLENFKDAKVLYSVTFKFICNFCVDASVLTYFLKSRENSTSSANINSLQKL